MIARIGLICQIRAELRCGCGPWSAPVGRAEHLLPLGVRVDHHHVEDVGERDAEVLISCSCSFAPARRGARFDGGMYFC